MLILGRVKNAIFSLERDDQVLVQQKSCQQCLSSTWEFIPPAVTTKSSSTSSHKLHLLFTQHTWGTVTVKLTALTLSKEPFQKGSFFTIMSMLLTEAKGCFCIKQRICKFGARWGMVWSSSGCLVIACSAAANFWLSDLRLWYENTEICWSRTVNYYKDELYQYLRTPQKKSR